MSAKSLIRAWLFAAIAGLVLPDAAFAEQFVLFDATFTYTKEDADNSKPSKSHYYIREAQLNPKRPKDWTTPVDYRNGTIHLRTEVLEKPAGGEPTTWSICYIPNKGQKNGYGCTGTVVYREKGIYEQDVKMTAFWQNDSIVWSEGIRQMDLVIKDNSGGSGHAHKRVDWEKFFPTKVRITVVQISAGSKYDPALVPNLPAGDVKPVASASAAERLPRTIPPGESPRERFWELIDRPRVPMNVSEELIETSDDVREIAFTFDTEAGQRVPGLLIAPKVSDGPRPVVIALHGTGGDKSKMRPLLRKFAARGVIGVAIDGRYAGERSGGAKGAEAYRAAMFETWKTGRGFPFFYDTVWDTARLIDYLSSRPDVNSQRIGAIGFSKGGIELYLAAAADERLAAVVPCIGVQSFGWALEHDAWQSRVGTIQSAVDAAAKEVGVTTVDVAFVRRFYDRVAPGLYREFDGREMLPLIAPRPLLVINGDRDDRTPREGLELCVAAARDAYERAVLPERFEFRLQPDTRTR